MGGNVARELKRSGEYRLLYYQPAPETGERIAIGLLLDDGIERVVHCDWQFKKTLRLYRWVDAKILTVTLNSLSEVLASGGGSLEEAVGRFGPQFTASAPREFVLPLTSALVEILLDKFVNVTPLRERLEGTVKIDPVAMGIVALVKSLVGGSTRVHTYVEPEAILWRNVGRLGSVAVAIKSATGWTLVDGVDLNVLTASKTIARADEVGRTFWRYSRLVAESDGPRVRRIGLVLNGNSCLKPECREARDYALHRLRADSDEAIDTATPEGAAILALELARAVQP